MALVYNSHDYLSFYLKDFDKVLLSTLHRRFGWVTLNKEDYRLPFMQRRNNYIKNRCVHIGDIIEYNTDVPSFKHENGKYKVIKKEKLYFVCCDLGDNERIVQISRLSPYITNLTKILKK